MNMKIQHIGLVVENIDETIKKWAFLGAEEIAPRLHGDEHGQHSALVKVGENYFELMQPIGDKGVVPKFFAAHGEGFHHFGMLVDDLDETCAELNAKGVEMIGKTVGDGRKGGFLHPKYTGYVIEFSSVPDLSRDPNEKPEF